MYKKGNVLQFTTGTTILILNDGIKGREFVDKYMNELVGIYSYFQSRVIEHRMSNHLARSYLMQVQMNTVWYNVLKGDEKFWISGLNLTDWMLKSGSTTGHK